MKKSISSNYNNRDISSSRKKRMRSNTPVQQKENVMHNDSSAPLKKNKVKTLTSQNVKEKKFNDITDHNDNLTISALTPSGSSISFSSSSSKDVSLTNNQQATNQKSNPSVEPKQKCLRATQRMVDDSLSSQKK